MFGRQPMLPINVQFWCKNTRHSCFHFKWLYPKSSRKRLDWAYKTAHEVIKKESEHSKRRYDQKHKMN